MENKMKETVAKLNNNLKKEQSNVLTSKTSINLPINYNKKDYETYMNNMKLAEPHFNRYVYDLQQSEEWITKHVTIGCDDTIAILAVDGVNKLKLNIKDLKK